VSDAAVVLGKRLRKQAASCLFLGSPLYDVLLRAAADDAEREGPTFALMKDLAFSPPGAALALKLMGAVHRLVLEGGAPALEPYYPSVGGTLVPEGAWPSFASVLEDRKDELQSSIGRPVQTNEVGRCGGFVGGFLEVAAATGLPLSLLEIGASGGLNLRWDEYRYEAGAASWGPPSSPVRLEEFERAPSLRGEAVVKARRGCDAHPIDPTTVDGRLTLTSYVWPDQSWRLRLLEGAFEVAEKVPVQVDEMGAAQWLEERLRVDEKGLATVVYHSIVMQYLGSEERGRVEELLHGAGARATNAAPFARLSMEPPEREDDIGDGLTAVRLTMWPGGDSRLIARCGFHGRPVRALEHAS
jgi:hypothetical protein